MVSGNGTSAEYHFHISNFNARPDGLIARSYPMVHVPWYITYNMQYILPHCILYNAS
jgi:hypothetical protein